MTTPIESAKTALAPFARAAEYFDRRAGEEDHTPLFDTAIAGVAGVKVGDYRRARSALKDLEGSAQGGVRVGKLVWQEFDESFWAESLVGTYNIEKDIDGTWTMTGSKSIEPANSSVEAYGLALSEAKAAAQADFERRILSALSASSPLPVHQVGGEAVAWPNGCDKLVPRALRFLADNDRPLGGEQTFNSAHLYQLAGEIERMASRPLFAQPQPQETVETLKRGEREAADEAFRLVMIRAEKAETRATNAEARIAELENAGQAFFAAFDREPDKDCWDTETGEPEEGAERFASDWSWADYHKRVQEARDALRAALAPDASKIEGAGL